MAYYFIMYMWKRIGDAYWEYSEEMSEKYPVQWLVDIRNNSPELYALIGWKEVPKKIYDDYKDEVG